jgi:hypothetical protein
MYLFQKIQYAFAWGGFLVSLNVSAQSVEYDTLSTIPSFRYQGGGRQFLETLMERISYPQEAYAENIQGIALISFVVVPSGEISHFTHINSLHPAIDREIEQAFEATRKGWKPFSTTTHMVFVLPIIFRSVYSEFTYAPIPWFCLNSMLVTIDTHMGEFLSDQELQQRLTYASTSPLPILDELIRRDPFSESHRLRRIQHVLAHELPLSPCADVVILQYFIRKSVEGGLLEACHSR